jgi:hypothetical protein
MKVEFKLLALQIISPQRDRRKPVPRNEEMLSLAQIKGI